MAAGICSSAKPLASSTKFSSARLTETGKLPIAVPRDRLATFEPQLIAKYRRRLPGFDDKVISMHARGLGQRRQRRP